jgi:large subunit ribosomal protein L17
MLRSLTTSLFQNGRIKTTVSRAAEVKRLADKIVTLAKKNTLHARRLVLRFLTVEDVVSDLFSNIAPRYSERNSGYTRIIKTGARRGDAAEMCVIELI